MRPLRGRRPLTVRDVRLLRPSGGRDGAGRAAPGKRFPRVPGLLALVLLVLTVSPLQAAPPLPRDKSVAVLVRSPSAQESAAAEAILIGALIDGGFRAVDQRQLERIRQAKAAALALEGDVEAILELSRSFGFQVLLSGRISVPPPVKNEFGLFTATAELALTACLGSNGRQIYADATTAKEVGYSAAEAARKALDSATRLAAGRMVEGAPAETAAADLQNLLVEVAGLRSFVEAHGIVESCTRAGSASARLDRFSAGVALVSALYPGSAEALARALLQQRSDLRLEGVEADRIRLSRR